MGQQDRWDRILAALPLNREAATVTSCGDVSGFRGEVVDHYLQDGPHPLKPKPVDPDFTDITGQRFGRLVVLGYAGRVGPGGRNTKGWWSVRCDCSRYTLRRRKPLRGGTATMCGECDLAESVKAGKVFWPINKGDSNGQR